MNRSSERSSVMFRTPIGCLEIVATDLAVVEVRFDGGAVSVDSSPQSTNGHPVLDGAVVQLAEYFAGTRTAFDLPIDPAGTPFQQAAWAVLRTIPYGETISYGQQARRLGDPNKSRAVGAANGRNPIPIIVPCHRVVGADGRLTGFAGGLEAKAWLLDHERRISAIDDE